MHLVGSALMQGEQMGNSHSNEKSQMQLKSDRQYKVAVFISERARLGYSQCLL